MQTSVTAVDLSIHCAVCNAPQELGSRAAVTAKRYGDHLCAPCAQERERLRKAKEKQEENERLAAHTQVLADLRKCNKPFNYFEIGYFEAVLAYAIMLASDEAAEHGQFRDGRSLNLCRSESLSGNLLGRLFNKGILQFSASTPPGAVRPGEGDSYSYFPHQVHWEFAKDSAGRFLLI